MEEERKSNLVGRIIERVESRTRTEGITRKIRKEQEEKYKKEEEERKGTMSRETMSIQVEEQGQNN